MPLDVITAIEEAVVTHLTGLVPALKGGVQKDSRQLLRDTSVAVAILDGRFEPHGQVCSRCDCTVSVLLKFKNVQSESARRKGINPLVTAVVQGLLGQRLGLGIGPLQPKSFGDVTSEDKYEAGVIEYLIEFTTWYDVLPLEEDQLAPLLIRLTTEDNFGNTGEIA
jgi:hypothetical protein